MSLASLAGYASSSDESDDDTGASQTPVRRTSKPESAQSTAVAGIDTIVDDDDEHHDVLKERCADDTAEPSSSPSSLLFSSLPAPKAELPVALPEEPLEAKVDTVPRPAKRRIVIPRLSELDHKDDLIPPTPKKIYKSSTGSSLLKMLPPPAALPVAAGSRTTLTQMAPHSLGKKPQPPKAKPRATPKAPAPAPKAPEEGAAAAEEGEDDNDAGPSAFFSFDEPKLSEEQLKNLISAEDLQPRPTRPPVSPPPVGPALVAEVLEDSEAEKLPDAGSSAAHDIPEAVLLQLRGRRQEKIELFSIDAAEFTAEARSSLVKNLTVEDSRPAPVAGSEPSQLHRSKHHITHLAFQAKARENELKNQWAANRMTKRETQKKYGF